MRCSTASSPTSTQRRRTGAPLSARIGRRPPAASASRPAAPAPPVLRRARTLAVPRRPRHPRSRLPDSRVLDFLARTADRDRRPQARPPPPPARYATPGCGTPSRRLSSGRDHDHATDGGNRLHLAQVGLVTSCYLAGEVLGGASPMGRGSLWRSPCVSRGTPWRSALTWAEGTPRGASPWAEERLAERPHIGRGNAWRSARIRRIFDSGESRFRLFPGEERRSGGRTTTLAEGEVGRAEADAGRERGRRRGRARAARYGRGSAALRR